MKENCLFFNFPAPMMPFILRDVQPCFLQNVKNIKKLVSMQTVKVYAVFGRLSESKLNVNPSTGHPQKTLCFSIGTEVREILRIPQTSFPSYRYLTKQTKTRT